MLKGSSKILNKEAPENGINAITAGSEVNGRFNASGDINIEGYFEGNITAGKSVFIGLAGEVEGNIAARDVCIAGRVKGIVEASHSVIIKSTGVIIGDTVTGTIAIDKGGVLNGNCKCNGVVIS